MPHGLSKVIIHCPDILAHQSPDYEWGHVVAETLILSSVGLDVQYMMDCMLRVVHDDYYYSLQSTINAVAIRVAKDDWLAGTISNMSIAGVASTRILDSQCLVMEIDHGRPDPCDIHYT